MPFVVELIDVMMMMVRVVLVVHHHVALRKAVKVARRMHGVLLMELDVVVVARAVMGLFFALVCSFALGNGGNGTVNISFLRVLKPQMTPQTTTTTAPPLLGFSKRTITVVENDYWKLHGNTSPRNKTSIFPPRRGLDCRVFQFYGPIFTLTVKNSPS